MNDLSIMIENTELKDSMMKTYSQTSLMESCLIGLYQYKKLGDVQTLLESMSDISEIMESLMGRSSNIIEHAVFKSANKYLKKLSDFVERNKKFFDDVNAEEIDFDVEGYVFSTLKCGRINLYEVMCVLKDFYDFSSTILSKDLTDRNPEVASKYDDIDFMRGIILGNGGVDVSRSDFLKETKKIYRSGGYSKTVIRVDFAYIKMILSSIDPLKIDLSRTQEELHEFNKSYDSCLNSLKSSQKILEKKLEDADDSDIEILYQNYITALRYKYSQIMELSDAVNILLTQRVYAIVDQITQYKAILEICKTDVTQKRNNKLNLTSSTAGDISRTAYTIPLLDATDYAEIALSQSSLCEAEYSNIMESRYLKEIQFVSESLSTGKVALMEAGGLSKRYQSFKASFSSFIDKLISMVRKKIVNYNKRYIPWVRDLDVGKLIEVANKMESIEIAPYYKRTSSVSSDLNDIIQAMGTVSKDKKDFSFTKTFTNKISSQDDYDKIQGQLVGYLKNYFRFGEKDKDSVQKEQIPGKNLKVDDMIQYILRYENYANDLEKLTRAFSSLAERMGATMESFSYLYLEERPSYQTELVLLEGYQALMEEDEKKTGTVTGEDGKEESPTSVKTEQSDDRGNDTDNDKKVNPSSRYENTLQTFFQLTISSYVTALEERFINFINIISTLAGGNPSVDSNGRYVSKNTKDNNTKSESVKESTLSDQNVLMNKPIRLTGLNMYK